MTTTARTLIPGDAVADPADFMKGYNTYIDRLDPGHADSSYSVLQANASAKDGDIDSAEVARFQPTNVTHEATGKAPFRIFSMASGVVETVERVVSVRGEASRYYAEVGDVVVGRVSDVLSGRWLVDVGSTHRASMLLSNVTEPGGMLRRRGRDDELTMRRLFAEGDLVAAEVQRVTPDGMVALHTRSAVKYGRLAQPDACFVAVKPSLIRRMKHHYHTFRFGITAILGVNGGFWLMRTTEETLSNIADQCGEGSDDVEEETLNDEDGAEEGGMKRTGSSAVSVIDDSAEARSMLARTKNCCLALSNAGVTVDPDSISAAVAASLNKGMQAYDVVNAPEIVVAAAILKQSQTNIP